MIEIACGFCGKPFDVFPSQQKRRIYCSKECAVAGKLAKSKETHPKEWFEEMYLKRGLTYQEIAKETDCTTQTVWYYLKLYNIPLRNALRTPPIEIICKWCQKPFTTHQCEINTGKGVYCSNECRYKASQNRVDRICKWCDKLFREKPSRVNKGYGIYCSAKCRGEAQAGEGHYNFKDWASRKPYCEKWTPELRERVREFQGRTCLICGMDETENGERLCVHHVDDDKDVCCNDRPPVFAAVCRRHNIMAIYDQKRWQHIFHRIIDELYNGKSYYTKEEFAMKRH